MLGKRSVVITLQAQQGIALKGLEITKDLRRTLGFKRVKLGKRDELGRKVVFASSSFVHVFISKHAKECFEPGSKNQADVGRIQIEKL